MVACGAGCLLSLVLVPCVGGVCPPLRGYFTSDRAIAADPGERDGRRSSGISGRYRSGSLLPPSSPPSPPHTSLFCPARSGSLMRAPAPIISHDPCRVPCLDRRVPCRRRGEGGGAGARLLPVILVPLQGMAIQRSHETQKLLVRGAVSP